MASLGARRGRLPPTTGAESASSLAHGPVHARLAINRGLALPAESIEVVHRADASGTTWIFTNYLSRASRAWTHRVGRELSVAWSPGVSGNGNPGVAAIVNTMLGAIGYVEYAHAKANKLAYVRLCNKA